jgi:hypothetical protein
MLLHSFSVHYFWISSAVLQLILVAVILRKDLQREFPFFLGYTAYRASTALVLFYLDHAPQVTPEQFGYANWVHQLGCIIFRFAVIYELFIAVTKPYPELKSIFVSVFRGGTVMLAGIALAVAWYADRGPYLSRLWVGLMIVDRAASIVQCGLLVSLFAFSNYLRLSWRNFAMGLALGLGIFAAVDLATAAIRLEMASYPIPTQERLMITINWVTLSTYQACVLMWLTYALLPQRATQVCEVIPEHDLESWNDELERLLHR